MSRADDNAQLIGAGLPTWRMLARWGAGEISDAALADFLTRRFNRAGMPSPVAQFLEKLRDRNQFPQPSAFQAVGLSEEPIQAPGPSPDDLTATMIAEMTDAELARSTREAERLGLEVIPDLLNEICNRLNLPADETNQGLTEFASAVVDTYIDTFDPKEKS